MYLKQKVYNWNSQYQLMKSLDNNYEIFAKFNVVSNRNIPDMR